MSTKSTIRIQGLQHIASSHLEKTIESFAGVQAVEIDPENECAVIEHDGADLHSIETAIRGEGLKATLA